MALHRGQGLTYELVVSPRAKRASLRVVPGRGLVVSIPKRFSQASVEQLVESNRDWINTCLNDIEANTPEHLRQWPPQNLPLKAMDKQLLLRYADTQGGGCISPQGEDQLYFQIDSPADEKVAVAQEVANHLKQIARAFLPPLLASYAHLHGLHYQRVSIRGQRTLWGSFSSSGTLSLNYKLLFLDRELVDYVLLHELAHTVHLDHSEAFWQLLCRMNVNARTLDSQLSSAGQQVPPWLELAR